MPGFWEKKDQFSVLCAILHTDQTTIAWAFGLRGLLPVHMPVMGLSGMPFDMARNTACMRTLEGGFTHCLRSDCIVETSKGGKRIRDVVIGDLVRTHLNNLRPVTHVFSRDLAIGAPLKWVHTANSIIKCTPEHPFFVSRNRGSGRFIRAQDLCPGDEVLYPNRWEDDWLNFDVQFNTLGVNGDGKLGSKKNGQHLGRIPVTKQIAEFLGLYLAEGCSTHDGICFTFGNTELHLIKLVKDVSRILFDRKPSVTSRWATNVKINVRPLGELFGTWFGNGARSKRVPDFVFGWTLENKLSFLYGYLEGDGSKASGLQTVGGHSYQRSPIWSFRTSSESLVKGIEKLAGSCGMRVNSCSVRACVAVMKTGQEIRSGSSWHGWLAKKSGDKMMDLLNVGRDGDYLRIPVIAVEDKRVSSGLRDKRVWNLEVLGDESYVVDFASVHNCFFLDSDVVAPPDAVLKLASHNLPVVSGMYCRRSPPHAVPVMIKNGQWVTQFKPGSLVEVDVVGAGCLLIKREVLEKCPPQRPGKHWFDWRVDMRGLLPDGECLSEDFTFNVHLRNKLGVKTYVDTSVICKHIGLAQAGYGTFEPCNC